MPDSRIYLDNAATSWPKPESVYQAMDEFLRTCGGSAGRGGHAAATQAQRVVDQARTAVARYLNAPSTDSVAFMFNGTDALNAAITGALRPGDHVVTTVCEHNSVLRPLYRAQSELGCELTIVDCDDRGVIDAGVLLSAVRPETRLVAVTHASNVTGAIQPVAEICAALQGAPPLVLIDAAQSVGHVPINLRSLGVDLLAASGHKGLLGPTGTGLLYVKPGVEEQLRPWRTGGSGMTSEDTSHPQAMPHRFEAGNLNVVGLAGLLAGVNYLNEQGAGHLQDRCNALASRLIDGLRALPGAQIMGPADDSPRTPVVSVLFEGYDPHEAAAVLEMSANIQCRAGLHCAPLMHQRLGVANKGGTVRFSTGWFTSESDIDCVIAAACALASP